MEEVKVRGVALAERRDSKACAERQQRTPPTHEISVAKGGVLAPFAPKRIEPTLRWPTMRAQRCLHLQISVLDSERSSRSLQRWQQGQYRESERSTEREYLEWFDAVARRRDGDYCR